MRSEEGRIKTELLLKMGELKAKVKPQKVIRSGFTVRTPTGTTSVRGTIFINRYDDKTQITTISVEESEVLVTPENSLS